MSISSCYDDISRYNALKASLANIVGSLNLSATKLAPVSNTIYSAYSVDESQTPVVGRIDQLQEDIASTANYISKVVMPAIDQAISNKRREIFRLEQEKAQNSGN